MSVRAKLENERGFVLATVLVFLVVLTLSAFFASMVSRSSIQVVNNVQNEREAFYAAEAGVTEALVRLGMSAATSVTVDGGTFDASFRGTYVPDPARTDWKAQILFSGAAPTKTGNTVTTPSIQPAAARLAYSTPSASADSLTLAWNLCTAAGPGCTAPGAIRKVGGKAVLDIISTGQSGLARRKVTQQVVLDILSAVVLQDTPGCVGIRTQGNGTVAFPAGVQVNCASSDAIAAGGNAAITAAGSITTSGSGYSGNISPTPSTLAPQVPDPLATLTVPSFGVRQVRSGTAASPVTFQTSGTQTIQPGIYYGGISIDSGDIVTMAPGVYILAGGGFSVTSNAQVTSDPGGIMLYNTCAVPPAPGVACALSGAAGYSPIQISNNRPIRMTAMTAAAAALLNEVADYAGIVFFQDRMNSRSISLTAGTTGLIDGLIYAPLATLTMSGGADLLHSQLLVGAIDLQGGPMISAPTDWVPIGTGAGAKPLAWQDF